jgi:hypothetical protein
MHQTKVAFDHECHELRVWIEQIQLEQEQITRTYVNLLHSSAIFIQRVFRGFLARRTHREALALRAVRKIQRVFRAKQVRRAERRRQFRVLSKKILRGIKGIAARHQLAHNELLNRVNHNMMIEHQWRLAMGVADAEGDVFHALYRRKCVRRRVSTHFRNVVTMRSITAFWQRLAPHVANDESGEAPPLDPTPMQMDNNERDPDQAQAITLTLTKPSSLFEVAQQLSPSPSKQIKAPTSPVRLTRDDLRRRQKQYTQRVYEEHLRKEAVRAMQAEKQRESARLAEEARKLHEDEQRRLRLVQALALREDLERRGLLATKELQARKEEELRKEEEVTKRVLAAKERIAKEVLSDETQLLLARRQRGFKI